MSQAIFDSLGYARKLEKAGVSREQAEVQADAMREMAQIITAQEKKQTAAMNAAIEKYDKSRKDQLSTKGDIQEVRLEIEKVRAEIEKVRAELKTDIERIRAEIATVKYSLLKWQIGIGVALVAVMAKGFGWLGF